MTDIHLNHFGCNEKVFATLVQGPKVEKRSKFEFA